MRVIFDRNIGSDVIYAWGVSVPIFRRYLFGKTEEERKRKIKEKIGDCLDSIVPIIERKIGSEVREVRVSLESAWTRYYVFKLNVNNRFNFALNILSPNSPIKSFKRYRDIAEDVCRRFKDNVAEVIAIDREFMVQRWVDGVPLSNFKDGNVIVDVERAKMCIPLVVSLLYRLNKAGYVYTPWDDYEAMLKDDKIVLLDITRFVRRRLDEEEFLEFYYGVPFTSPEILKSSDDPSHKLYWRGVCEKDYFGTSRDEYVRLFMIGVCLACETFDEVERVCKPLKDSVAVQDLINYVLTKEWKRF